MKSYRMYLNASVNLSVQANSEEEAIQIAENAIRDLSNGFALPDGDGYNYAVLYTSTEESAEVVDEEEI